MRTIGIIGFGSMGSMLAEALLRNDVVEPRAICLYSRTAERYAEFCAEHFEVVVARSITDLVAKSEIVFICVPPASVKPVLQEISESDVQDKAFVSFASSVTIDCLSSIVGRRVSRIIPNINTEVDEGLFLVCHGPGIDSESASRIEGLLSKIGVVYRIPESQIEIYTDLTSCSLGIFSSLFATFVDSSLQFGKIDKDLATAMVIQSLYGVTKLYKEKRMGFEETIRRVARKGGVTEVGISVILEKQPLVFQEVFEKTLQNHKEKRLKTLGDYGLTSAST